MLGPQLGRPGALARREFHRAAVGPGGLAGLPGVPRQEVTTESMELGPVVEGTGGPDQLDRLLDQGQLLLRMAAGGKRLAEQPDVVGMVQLGTGGQVPRQPGTQPAHAVVLGAGVAWGSPRYWWR